MFVHSMRTSHLGPTHTSSTILQVKENITHCPKPSHLGHIEINSITNSTFVNN
jgi:hypothetical protein